MKSHNDCERLWEDRCYPANPRIDVYTPLLPVQSYTITIESQESGVKTRFESMLCALCCDDGRILGSMQERSGTLVKDSEEAELLVNQMSMRGSLGANGRPLRVMERS